MKGNMEHDMESGVMKELYRDPSMQTIPTLGPRVYKYSLHWAICNLYEAWNGTTVKFERHKQILRRLLAWRPFFFLWTCMIRLTLVLSSSSRLSFCIASYIKKVQTEDYRDIFSKPLTLSRMTFKSWSPRLCSGPCLKKVLLGPSVTVTVLSRVLGTYYKSADSGLRLD